MQRKEEEIRCLKIDLAEASKISEKMWHKQ